MLQTIDPERVREELLAHRYTERIEPPTAGRIDHPDHTVRQALFPVGSGSFRDLVAEYKQSGPTYRRSVQTILRASYTSHYRKGLIRLLEVLVFRSGNTAYQPVIAALKLIGRHAHDGNTSYWPLGEHIPVHSGTLGDWRSCCDRTMGAAADGWSAWPMRMARMAYEVTTFQALRDRLRCKAI